jgi:hypothetical protein
MLEFVKSYIELPNLWRKRLMSDKPETSKLHDDLEQARMLSKKQFDVLACEKGCKTPSMTRHVHCLVHK